MDIPRSRQNPKILWVDDAKIIGDGIAIGSPVFRNLLAQECQHCAAEAVELRVTSIVGDVFVHQSPEPLDGVQMRAIGWDEVQPDAAIGLGQPFLHQSRMVISGVIQKDVNELLGRIHCHDRDEQHDRAARIDGQGFDHFGLAGFQVDGAVDVQPVASAVLFNGDLYILGRPAAYGAYRVGRVNGIGERLSSRKRGSPLRLPAARSARHCNR